MLRVFLHPEAEKDLRKIPEKNRRQIFDKLEEFETLNHPLQHPRIIKLTGRKTEDFRLRVGDYRIKFTLTKEHTILVTHIQHRQVGY